MSSPAFPRQGYPLSSLLFNIAIEPLSILLESSPDMEGIKVGGKEIKLALFADVIFL